MKNKGTGRVLLVLWIVVSFVAITGAFSLAFGKTETITFEGTANGQVITHAYQDRGVILRCKGLRPESDMIDDTNMYSWRDGYAKSGYNVMGGRFAVSGSGYSHWLSHAIGYGVARFVKATDYVRLYGIGGPFMVHVYGKNDVSFGTYHSKVVTDVSHPTRKPVNCVEIRVSNPIKKKSRIQKIVFGSRYSQTASDLTYFDDFSFNVNELPIAHAGTNETFYEGETVMLDGSGSNDPDGESDIISYAWVQIEGPPVKLSDDSIATPNFVVPPVEDNGTTLSFELTIKDAWGYESTAEVTFDILDNGIENEFFPPEAYTMSSATLEPIAIETGDGMYLTRLEPVDPYSSVDTLEQMPDDMLYGMIDFDAVVETPGDVAVLNIYLPSPAPERCKWYKYSPELGWFDFSREVISEGLGDGAELNDTRQIVTLYITDNGSYDDNSAEGIVTDPSGLGAEAVEEEVGGSTAVTTSGTSAGDAGGGGCFISSAADSISTALLNWW